MVRSLLDSLEYDARRRGIGQRRSPVLRGGEGRVRGPGFQVSLSRFGDQSPSSRPRLCFYRHQRAQWDLPQNRIGEGKACGGCPACGSAQPQVLERRQNPSVTWRSLDVHAPAWLMACNSEDDLLGGSARLMCKPKERVSRRDTARGGTDCQSSWKAKPISSSYDTCRG